MWLDTKLTLKKSVVLIYTNDKWAEKEIGESTPFTIVTNSIKYCGDILTKQVKYLAVILFKPHLRTNCAHMNRCMTQ